MTLPPPPCPELSSTQPSCPSLPPHLPLPFLPLCPPWPLQFLPIFPCRAAKLGPMRPCPSCPCAPAPGPPEHGVQPRHPVHGLQRVLLLKGVAVRELVLLQEVEQRPQLAQAVLQRGAGHQQLVLEVETNQLLRDSERKGMRDRSVQRLEGRGSSIHARCALLATCWLPSNAP